VRIRTSILPVILCALLVGCATHNTAQLPSTPAVTNEVPKPNEPKVAGPQFQASCSHLAWLWRGPMRDSSAEAVEDALSHNQEWHEGKSGAGVIGGNPAALTKTPETKGAAPTTRAWPIAPFNIVYNNNNETISPLTYADKKNGLIYRVESDGRHVSASTGDGKQLWRRNPFVDAQMEQYRQTKPVIRAIGAARDLGYTGDPDTIWIRFSSSQIGYLDPATGDFYYVLRD
jgi:hypothetical protein